MQLAASALPVAACGVLCLDDPAPVVDRLKVVVLWMLSVVAGQHVPEMILVGLGKKTKNREKEAINGSSHTLFMYANFSVID